MTTSIKRVTNIIRHPDGFWHHPQFPLMAFENDLNPEAAVSTWLDENGLGIQHVFLRDDPNATSCWANFLMNDVGIQQAAVKAWNPPPPSPDWFMVALLDSPKGPMANFVKRLPPKAYDIEDKRHDEKYYVAAFHHRIDGFMLWVAHNEQGYTPDLSSAGLFSKSEAWRQHGDSEGKLIPVPVPFIRTLRVRRVVDLGDSLNSDCNTASGLSKAVADFVKSRNTLKPQP